MTLIQRPSTMLVFGGSGRTGQHFVRLALEAGHNVRVVARTPAKLEMSHPNLHKFQGSIADTSKLDVWLSGSTHVIAMLGDKTTQQTSKINTIFVMELVPAMRRQGVKRLLYQSGAFSQPYGESSLWSLWMLRHTMIRASGFKGQHEDNEAVAKYLVEEAQDLEWYIHRAAIGGESQSKGRLVRSGTTGKFNIGNYVDCAEYSLRLVMDDGAVHSQDLTYYAR